MSELYNNFGNSNRHNLEYCSWCRGCRDKMPVMFAPTKGWITKRNRQQNVKMKYRPLRQRKQQEFCHINTAEPGYSYIGFNRFSSIQGHQVQLSFYKPLLLGFRWSKSLEICFHCSKLAAILSILVLVIMLSLFWLMKNWNVC